MLPKYFTEEFLKMKIPLHGFESNRINMRRTGALHYMLISRVQRDQRGTNVV